MCIVILCSLLQDVVFMCQALERLFDQKVTGMPAEVRGRERGRGRESA